MQPNHKVTCTHFGVDGPVFGIAVNATRCEAKRFNQKVMCRWNVLAHEDRNESFDLVHGWFLHLQRSYAAWRLARPQPLAGIRRRLLGIANLSRPPKTERAAAARWSHMVRSNGSIFVITKPGANRLHRGLSWRMRMSQSGSENT